MDALSHYVSQFAVTLRGVETTKTLHRNAIDQSRTARTMRASQGKGETVIRKDANFFERQARWWSAPVRSRAATLARLLKATSPGPAAPSHPWVRQAPNGIRV
jgi:hypothetical protein